MLEPLIEALAAAGVPSVQAKRAGACAAEACFDDPESSGTEVYQAGQRAMIATDAPRILRVLLEARLKEIAGNKSEREALTRAVVDALWYRKEGDDDAVSLPVAIRAVLDIATPPGEGEPKP